MTEFPGGTPLERLWATWRMKYISAIHEKSDGCIFCDLTGILVTIVRETKSLGSINNSHIIQIIPLMPWINGRFKLFFAVLYRQCMSHVCIPFQVT